MGLLPRDIVVMVISVLVSICIVGVFVYALVTLILEAIEILNIKAGLREAKKIWRKGSEKK